MSNCCANRFAFPFSFLALLSFTIVNLPHRPGADQQELQNEVGALLEFRDLVIETFPDLKNKMASISASSTITGVPSSSSLASR